MRVTIFLVCMAVACGGETGQGPAPADGGDAAAADAASDTPRGISTGCSVSRLDCDKNGTCETLRDEANCRGCGIACATGEICLSGLCVR